MLLLIIIFVSLLIVAALGFSLALTNRRKALEPQSAKEFKPTVCRSLFEQTAEEIAVFERREKEQLFAGRLENQKQNLLARAEKNDYTVLTEAAGIGDSRFYKKTLDLLTEKNKIKPENLFRLAAFVSDNKLFAAGNFSDAVLSEWRENPRTNFLPTILHISALTGSAESYLQTIETIFDSWKQNELKRVSANALFAAFDAHYRLLPTGARTSGAGFLLKEKLASIRREVSGK